MQREKDKRKMGQIKVEKNAGGIEGLCVIEPSVHGDQRGYAPPALAGPITAGGLKIQKKAEDTAPLANGAVSVFA